MVILSVVIKSIPVLCMGGAVLLIDALVKGRKISQNRIAIGFPKLLLAVLRSYLAFFYHCCAFVSRYYLILGILLASVHLWTASIICGMHLTAGIVEYFVKRPDLNICTFLFYFSLEQLSYQSGVWWECVRKLKFSSINPDVSVQAIYLKPRVK